MPILYIFGEMEQTLWEYHRINEELRGPSEGLIFHVAATNDRGKLIVAECF